MTDNDDEGKRLRDNIVREVFTSVPIPRPKAKKKQTKLNVNEVCKTIVEERGLISRIAEKLGTTRAKVKAFIVNHDKCAKILKENREALGDLAEKKLYELIEKGEYKAIVFYLTVMCKDRGFVLPTGISPISGDTNTMTVNTINILAVPSGRYLTPEEIEALTPADDAA
jgi:hypothetical protein